VAVDKKINYAIQGGGPNYLGKQKMVKAPKKWKSSPTHPEAHLAYITDKEQDLLIKKNLYGSLKGKPNKGPSGIVSLQGDLGGWILEDGAVAAEKVEAPRMQAPEKGEDLAKIIKRQITTR